MKLTTFTITVAASFTICLLAQTSPQMPPSLPPPPLMLRGPLRYHDALASIGREMRETKCPLCKRGGPQVHLMKYEWQENIITDGIDKPRSCIERFNFRCNICVTEWRKNQIVK